MRILLKQAITILNYNLRDNCNSYILEEGDYVKKVFIRGKFDLFKEFYNLKKNNLEGSIIL